MATSDNTKNRTPAMCEALEGREFRSSTPWSTIGHYAGKFAVNGVIAQAVKYGYGKTGHTCPAPWYVPKFGGITHHLTCAKVAK